MMKYFDLHCDTATEIYKFKIDLDDTRLHINSKALSCFKESYQLCAVFTDDTKKSPGMDYFKAVVDNFLPMARKVKGFYPIVSIESGGILEGNIENLNVLKEYDVKVFGFTWNGENELGCGSAFDNNKPLTEFGREVLTELNNLNIIPDISHLSDGGVYDIMNLSDKPFFATHSNSRTICEHKRNLTDDQIKEIIRRGGLIGINLYPPFISQTDPSLDCLMKHIYHMLVLGGKDNICLGCDWDGMPPTSDIKDVTAVNKIYKKVKETFTEEMADKIVFENAFKTFSSKLKLI